MHETSRSSTRDTPSSGKSSTFLWAFSGTLPAASAAPSRNISSELLPVSGRIVRIELAYRSEHRCTASGNCEIERARFVYRDAAGNERNGEVVDIHLRAR